MKTFLRWLLMVSVMSVGAFVANHYGVFSTLNEADSTYISVAIIGWFVFSSIHCGRTTWKLGSIPKEEVIASIEKYSFAAGAYTTLGMIGTVIGFIMALGAFTLIDTSNPASIQLVIKQLVAGVGPALYTTLTGLCCALLLRFQTVNLSLALNRHDDSAEVMS